MHGPVNVKFINESTFAFNMNALTLEGKWTGYFAVSWKTYIWMRINFLEMAVKNVVEQNNFGSREIT
jgi:hypothetical protein